MVVNGFSTENAKEERGKDWPQILAVFIGSIGALSDGIIIAWPSPSTVAISKNKDDYDISEEEAAYLTVFSPIGLMLASLFFFQLNDIIGRKSTYILIAIPHLIFWIMTMFAKDVYVFYAARLISGIGDAALFTSFPMYIGEVCTPRVRGTWGNAMTFWTFGGQFVINVVGSYCGIRQTAYILSFLPIIFFITFFFMPESPYFCVMKGNSEKARSSLQFLHRKQNVDMELASLKADVERQMSESSTWRDLISIRSNRRALLAGVFLRVFQQMSGIAVFSSYTQYVFEKAGGNITAQTSAIIFTGVNWILILVGGIALGRFGRKKAFMCSSFSCGTILLIQAIYFYLDEWSSIDVTSANWIPLAGMMMYILCFSLGMGVVPTLMLGELFSASIKTKGLCCLNITFGVGMFISVNLFNVINPYTGLYGPFLLFALFCFVGTVLTIYIVPETKGKTLEEIQQILKA